MMLVKRGMMIRNKILFLALILGTLFFISNASADLYLNSKVGTIYFNTSGISRASIGPGGNFSINTSDFFVNSNLGRVGIGTTTPLGGLEVANGNIVFGKSGAISYTSVINTKGVLYYDTNNGDLTLNAYSTGGNTAQHFFTSNAGTNAERLTILNSGNVGIGTTTPSNLLDVRGVINASGDIYFNNGTKVGLGNLSGGGTAGYIPQWSGTSTLNNSGIYYAGGRVGIGTTSPQDSIEINGSDNGIRFNSNLPVATAYNRYLDWWDNSEEVAKIGITGTSGTDEGQLDISTFLLTGLDSPNIVFSTSSVERMRIAGAK